MQSSGQSPTGTCQFFAENVRHCWTSKVPTVESTARTADLNLAAILPKLGIVAKFDFNDIEEAFEFVNSSPYEEVRAIVCKNTGKILVKSDLSDIDEIGDIEEDLENYVEVPDKRDLDLGQPLVRAFVTQHIPEEYNRVMAMFRRRGAYRQFKDFLTERSLIQTWYDFEYQCKERALREWCRENGIELSN